MRILVCMCILSGCLAAQDPAKTPPSPAAKQTKKAPAVTAIPKGAVETTPGFYRWTDKDGKVWTYRRTPFGVSRWPADSVDTQQSAADKQNAVAGRTTAFAPFPETTDYFGDAGKAFMVNFRVANLDAMLVQLRAAGIAVELDPQVYPNGRFARLYDPEGNPIELWEPIGRDAPGS